MCYLIFIVETMIHYNQSILLPPNFWIVYFRYKTTCKCSFMIWALWSKCVNEGYLWLTAVMLEIYPLFCYTHPFQHWLGLIWLEFSLHPASDLIWRHDLWPSIVFGLICFCFPLFFPLRKLWALFSSCFINLLINLISDLKWNLWIRADSQSLLSVLQGD